MHTVIIVIHLMVVLTMTGLILIQKSEGGGLGMGGGGGGSGGGFLSSRGTSNVLSRSTAILAAVFFGTSVLLSVLAGLNRNPTSILGTGNTPPGQTAPLGTGRGVLDQLQPPAPATPAPAQVPQSQ